jgi:hypothetical protein
MSELWNTAATYAREAFEGTRPGVDASDAYEAARSADPYGQYPLAEQESIRAQQAEGE